MIRWMLILSLLASTITFLNCSDDSDDSDSPSTRPERPNQGGGTTIELTNCTSGTDTTESITTMINSPEVIECVTNISPDAPDWVKDNFKCVTVRSCDDYLEFTTDNLPPFKTGYYSESEKTTTFPSTGLSDGSSRNKNPNSISSQSITMIVPKEPEAKTADYDGTSLGCVGLTTYGVCIFNNQAAPGDSLEDEFATFDNGDGHPENTGVYHHHTEPYYLTSDDNTLIGLMADGYPVYGKKSEDGSYPTLDSETFSTACSPSAIGETQCYHVANGSGVNALLIGEYYKGTKGSIQ